MADDAPALYVFDAYGTLFDVHSAIARHAARVGPDAPWLSDLWRAKQLEYCWVRTLACAPWRDFEMVTEEALDHALSRCPVRDPTVREDLLLAYRSLDAFPEVAGTLSRLRRAGSRLAILSNGTSGMLAAALASAGLDDVFEAVLSVDAIGRYKTDPAVYDLVGERFGLPPAAVSFQSSNRWDIAAARLAGFRTVWVNRSGAREEYPDCPPDRVVVSLADLLESVAP